MDILRQERSTRCVVVRSLVPDIFCPGADLKERMAMTQTETAEFVSSLRTTMSNIQVRMACLVQLASSQVRHVPWRVSLQRNL